MMQSKNHLLAVTALNGSHAVIQAGTMPFFGLKKKPACVAGFRNGAQTSCLTARQIPRPAPDFYTGVTTLRRFSHNFMSFIFLRRSR